MQECTPLLIDATLLPGPMHHFHQLRFLFRSERHSRPFHIYQKSSPKGGTCSLAQELN